VQEKFQFELSWLQFYQLSVAVTSATKTKSTWTRAYSSFRRSCHVTVQRGFLVLKRLWNKRARKYWSLVAARKFYG